VVFLRQNTPAESAPASPLPIDPGASWVAGAGFPAAALVEPAEPRDEAVALRPGLVVELPALPAAPRPMAAELGVLSVPWIPVVVLPLALMDPLLPW